MNPAAPSPLEYALLGMIRQGTNSGYALRKQFATTPMGHYSDSPGSIYPALRRIEGRSWIRLVREEGGRGKQLYQLTRPGENALRAWMTMPIEREDVVRRLDELLLRFALMGEVADQAAAVAFLEAFERETSAYARELRSIVQAIPEVRLPTARLALDNGLVQYLAHARWARRALASLRRSK